MNSNFEIISEVEPAVSYAAWQNSIPLVRSLVVKNHSPEPISNVELRLKTSSGFLKAKVWRMDRLLAGDDLTISDISVELDPVYLSGLNEAEKSLLEFELVAGGKTLASNALEVRVLACNEWGGMRQGGELIAAFVMPNDSAIASILKSAANVLERHGHSSALDGYQANDPKRASMFA